MSAKIRLTLLGLWLGAMTFFSFVVAPGAFAVLPQQQFAGALVSRTLGVLEIAGIIISALLSLILVFERGSGGKGYRFEQITVAAMGVSMILSHFAVAPRMNEIRLRVGEIAQLAASDPVRLEFDRLHQYSVWLMSFNIIGAIALIVYLARRND